MKIEVFKKMVNTPAVAFAARAWVAMLDDRLCDPTVIWLQWDDGAILATVDGEPIGVITYNYSEWNRTIYVRLGFVSPDRRGLGVYRKLWERLISVAQELNCYEVRSATNIGNRPMRAVAERLGRAEEQVTLVYRLPAAAEAK